MWWPGGACADAWWKTSVTNICPLGEAGCISGSATSSFRRQTKPSTCGLCLCILPAHCPRRHPRRKSLRTCCVHCYHFADRLSNYHVKVTSSVTESRLTTRLHQSRRCGRFRGWGGFHPSVFSPRQLLKMRPGAGVRRVDVLLWSRAE